MAITAQIKYRSNPRYHADSIPVVFGSGSDSRILYDGGNDEWTVQTKNASGTFVDRLRIEANTNTPDIDAVDLPIKWPAGRAVTAGDYSIGRDADGDQAAALQRTHRGRLGVVHQRQRPDRLHRRRPGVPAGHHHQHHHRRPHNRRGGGRGRPDR